MEITYTDHLILRLNIRKIPREYPGIISRYPQQKFFDNIEGNYIAIKKLKYNGKLRNMMVAYDIKDGKIEIITIHPISDEKIRNRILTKRWTKNG